METVEEPLVHNSIVEEVQVSISDGATEITSDANECHKENGVAESDATANSDLAALIVDPATQDLIDASTDHEVVSKDTGKSCEAFTETVIPSDELVEVMHAAVDIDNPQTIVVQPDSDLPQASGEVSKMLVDNSENVISHEDLPQPEDLLSETHTESNDTVTFKTEILVERNENDVNETDQNNVNKDELDSSKNILSALGQNLELSDVLHADAADNMENNNSSGRQEVLNKEELLDILEGNDADQADDQFVKIIQVDHANIKTLEAQLALEQLTRLKSSKSRKSKSIDKVPRRKKGEKRTSENDSNSEVKSKKDKPSEVSAEDSDKIHEGNKGKRDKKNEGNSSKTLDNELFENKSHKKDKKTSETTKDDERSPTETKSKKEKQAQDLTSNEDESAKPENKNKRNKKNMDTISKLAESSIGESANKTRNNEGNQGEETMESDSNKSNSLKENIVNVLVRDWEDDEHDLPKDDLADKLLQETIDLEKSAEQLATAQEVVIDPERIDGSSMDSSASFVSEGQISTNKSGDESQPQRRLGRVIKKKVIFDPDNPDTFTKGKVTSKSKEPQTNEKEQPTPKKIKIEGQTVPKSKSPTGKLHWKKPTPKASKQNKRLTEIDKLLMDEGAVNMIYQLTPEAPKGKKNMRTKAEFIKKLQSSTPDGKEMKFRERKKENSKGDEAEAKKIAGGKQRGSLSSSVKSISMCEDFEAHSADDSIIYRRHSSSSYSSNCMSPLRVNDQESGAAARLSRQPSDSQNVSIADEESVGQITDVFMSENNTSQSSEVINKTDCLSIKQKLNSKLSHVLNKRKREVIKTDKPVKQKKVSTKQDDKKDTSVKSEEQQELSKLKTVTVTFNNNLAEISVKRKGDQQSYTVQTLKELQQALAFVNTKEEIAVTLLTSECGMLCSSLDLNSILVDNMDIRTNNAFGLAESIRSLLSTVEQHGKLLCTGVWGPCWGVGLALAALSDVTVASERARFAFENHRAPLLLGTAALTSHSRRLPKPLVDNLVLFGRQLSAAEALEGGLVSRVLWPDRIVEQLREVAKDIARQPSRGLLIKKQLLTLNRSERTFQSCLEVERDLLADYWISEEAQSALRATLQTA